jgi:hypothetical protein
MSDELDVKAILERSFGYSVAAECDIKGMAARIAALETELAAALHWEDVDDEWTAAIDAAHPTRGGSHENYATAMEMVGHRHSKGQLVSLVCWLLTERDAARAATLTAEAEVTAAITKALAVLHNGWKGRDAGSSRTEGRRALEEAWALVSRGDWKRGTR